MNTRIGFPEKQGLYDPSLEKDSCGVGFVANVKGRASHQIVLDADQILRQHESPRCLRLRSQHRRRGWDPHALPDKFLRRVAEENFGVQLPKPDVMPLEMYILAQECRRSGAKCKQNCRVLDRANGQRLIGWRPVPTCGTLANIGPTLKPANRSSNNCFIAAANDQCGDAFERKLYLVRKQAATTA